MAELKNARDSNLGSRYEDGFDFVVATTQASLNSGLKEYLSESTQPTTEVCFVTAEGGGVIHQTLEEFKKRSENTDPFSIRDGTAWTDARVQKAHKAGFSVGFKLRMGLPPRILPKDLPDIIQLLGERDRVRIRLLCSEFVLVVCTAEGSGRGTWRVFDQKVKFEGKNQMWYFDSTVSIARADLNRNLNTPYFDKHPQEKAGILRQLANLSGTAFGLQQLLLDMDTIVVDRNPEIAGLAPGHPARSVLNRYFKDYYAVLAKSHGWPLLGISAVAQHPDPSQLTLTDFDREVHLNMRNRDASTLDTLCVTNGRKLPRGYGFDWNWVDSNEVDQISGVIAINRGTAVNFFVAQLTERIKIVCLDFNLRVIAGRRDAVTLLIDTYQPRPRVDTVVYPHGDVLAEFRYEKEKHFVDHRGSLFAFANIKQTYFCLAYMTQDRIVVEQTAIIHLNVGTRNKRVEGNVCDFNRVDGYVLAVDAGGSLRFNHIRISSSDKSRHPLNFSQFGGQAVSAIEGQLVMMSRIAFVEVIMDVFGRTPAFVFPGSRTFTYTGAEFSSNFDLVCRLTYLSPSSSSKKGTLAETRGLNIKHSTELMENYRYGELVSPGGKFEALQTTNENGHALVFFVDSKNALSVFQEGSGTSTTGWTVSDLSTSKLSMYLAEDTKAAMRSFSVAQSSLDSTIGMAMAVDSNGADSLCVSLGNSSSNLSWIQGPTWKTLPFDAGDNSTNLRITNVMFAETYDQVQYLMVDVSTGSGSHGIVRYHIDTEKSTGKAWIKHDVPIDLQAGNYQSCVGRRHGGYVDGIYTAGNINGAPQLIYQPIINVFGGGPPTVVRLKVPDGVAPTAMTAVRNTDEVHDLYEETDLYVLAGKKLFRYPADKQTNDATGDLILEDDIFAGTNKLESMQVDGVVTLWGRNAAGEVYYISCYMDEVDDPSAWSFPVPIISDVSHVSAYVNRADGGNTIFAYGDGKFTRLTQATNTETKEWKPQEIWLEKTPKQDVHAFMSYTTTIHLVDQDGQPVPNTLLSLWANSHTPAYVNGKYIVLGVKEVQIPTDESGAITVVEATEDVQGSILSVCIPKDSLTTVIDPMANGFEKLSALDDATKLRQATYAANTVAGGVMDDAQNPLVDRATGDKEIEEVSQSIRHFKELYKDVRPPSTTSRLFYGDDAPRVVRRGKRPEKGTDVTWNPFTAIGDLWRKLKKAVSKVIKIIKDAATGLYEFVAEIGGKVYRAVMKAVNAIMGALEWVFNTIKTAVMAIIRFIQFLFSWNDIKRTKGVLHNVTKQFLKYQVSQIDSARVGFGERIDATAAKLREWGGVTDWSGLGDAARLPPTGSGEDPSSGHDSASLLFANHYKSQVNKLEVKGALPENSSTEASDLITVLLDAVSAQGAVLSDVYDQLKGLANDFKKLSVADIIKRIAAILGSGILSSVKVVVDALFRVLLSLAGSALDILDTKIHIPIISDILNAIGIPDISFLDLFCWISAVGYTVVYKVINGKAPFPDNDSVKAIISAASWKDLEAIFFPKSLAAGAATGGKNPNEALSELQKAMHASGHGVSSFLMFAVTFLSSLEALYAESGNPLSAPASVMGLIIAGLQAGASSLAPRYPIEDDIINVISTGVTVAKIACGLAFWGPVKKQLEAKNSGFKGLIDNDGRGTSAILDVIIVMPELVVTGWHFYELSKKPTSQERSAAIIGEVTNLTGYVSRVSYAVAVNSRDPVTKSVAVGVMAGGMIVGSGLQAARATQLN